MKNENICLLMSDRTTELLQQVKSGTISLEDAQRELNKMTKKDAGSGMSLKVTPKGCIGIYGTRKFPFSFYRSELEQILDFILEDGWSYSPVMQEFLEENGGKLTQR